MHRPVCEGLAAYTLPSRHRVGADHGVYGFENFADILGRASLSRVHLEAVSIRGRF